MVVLSSTQTYLLFINILVVMSHTQPRYLIAICTYPLLRHLLSNRYGKLFKKKIILYLLISRMLICIFPLLSITVLFDIVSCHKPLQWKVLPFYLLNPSCSFADARVFMSWCYEHTIFLCSLLACLASHINFSKSKFYLTQHFSFLRTVKIQWICLYLPSDKLLEIWQFAHSLLQKQPVTVHQVMSFLVKIAFYAKGYAQHH